jgi:hypothetical protein
MDALESVAAVGGAKIGLDLAQRYLTPPPALARNRGDAATEKNKCELMHVLVRVMGIETRRTRIVVPPNTTLSQAKRALERDLGHTVDQDQLTDEDGFVYGPRYRMSYTHTQ